MSRVCPLSGKEGTPHMLTSEMAPIKTGVPFTKCRKLGKGTSRTAASTTNDIIITVRLIGRRDRSHPSSRISGWPGGSLYPQSKRQRMLGAIKLARRLSSGRIKQAPLDVAGCR
jgi:hypothetical protein